MKPLIRSAIFLALAAGSVHAQSVPAFINYQGRVTDSAGAGLGTGTPVNRKMIFRLFDAATGGNRVWSEEQTVTVANGEFSVLLGNGINASYNSVTETPRDSLITIFSGGDRYLELVVDNGDGTFNTSDTPIAPRQRLTSTAYAMRAATADSVMSGSDLNLGTADSGLGSYNSGRLWNGQTINGPVLYGTGGGALGSKNGAAVNTAIRWDGSGNVGIGTASPTEKLDVTGNAKVSGSATFGSALRIGGGIAPPAFNSGGAGMRLSLYPGNDAEPPFGFGIDGGTLFSVVPLSASYKWYGGTGVKMSLSGSAGNLNVSGAGTFGSIGTTGNLTAGSLNAGAASISGNLTAGTTTVSGNLTAGTATISGILSAQNDITLNGQKVITLYDANHGLGYFGSAAAAPKNNFAGADVNGPVLYGYSGGALGSTIGSQKIALQWDSSQNLFAKGSLFAVGNVSAVGNVTAAGKSVAVGEENLRIVRGLVNSDGTRQKGQGLTSSKPGQGTYTITFSPAFADIPAVTATVWNSGGGMTTMVENITTTGCTIKTWHWDNQTAYDTPFTIIVVGPR